MYRRGEEEFVVAETNFSPCAIVGISSGPNWRNVIRTSHERPADDLPEFVMALSPDGRRDPNEVNDAVSRTATPGGRYGDFFEVDRKWAPNFATYRVMRFGIPVIEFALNRLPKG